MERFIPSTLMGLIIGWVAYQTQSVLPGIVIHFVHNGLLNTVLYYQEQLSFLGEGFAAAGRFLGAAFAAGFAVLRVLRFGWGFALAMACAVRSDALVCASAALR